MAACLCSVHSVYTRLITFRFLGQGGRRPFPHPYRDCCEKLRTLLWIILARHLARLVNGIMCMTCIHILCTYRVQYYLVYFSAAVSPNGHGGRDVSFDSLPDMIDLVVLGRLT